MPEGDTVWRTAATLERALSGRVLTVSDFRVPELATVDLTGQEVRRTTSRGKHLLTRIGEAHTLHTHLKMEGSWHLYRPGSAWRRPAYEARVVLANQEWTAVGFALGVVELLAREREEDPVAHLGPDLLGPDWDLDEAVARLASTPSRPLIEALLDQRNLAGVGNMYAAELCFLAGVPPQATVDRVPDLPRLVGRAQRLLLANRERAQQTTTGDLRPGRQLWVYGRQGQPCRRCGTRVRLAMRGEPGRQRASYWCPRCQPD